MQLESWGLFRPVLRYNTLSTVSYNYLFMYNETYLMESEDSNSVGETASIRPIPWLNDIANYILYTRECNALDAYLILSKYL